MYHTTQQQIQSTAIVSEFSNDPCECECDYQIILCPVINNIMYFVNGCPITPICSIPKQFNDMTCQYESNIQY